MPPQTPPASAPAAPRDEKKSRRVDVVATALGFYDHNRVRPGKRFMITLAPGQSLPKWVKEYVAPSDEAPSLVPPAPDVPPGQSPQSVL